MGSPARRLERVVGHLALKAHHGPLRTQRALTLDVESKGVLSDCQRDFYEENGYLVVKGLIPSSTIDRYIARFRLLCANPDIRPLTMTVMRDVTASKERRHKVGEGAIVKIQDWQDDPVLFEYCKNPAIVRHIRCFTGKDAKSIHTMVIHKPPQPRPETGRHPYHQDLHYFPLRPADRIVCSWTAMERVHRKNGCLSVYPGSHINAPGGRLLPHSYPDIKVNSMYHAIKDFQVGAYPRVHLEMDKGDTVFFHPLLVHGSGANRTLGYRKAISCHFAGDQCRYIDVHGTVQENIAQEVERIAAKRIAKLKLPLGPMTFNDIWAFKSRSVVD